MRFLSRPRNYRASWQRWLTRGEEVPPTTSTLVRPVRCPPPRGQRPRFETGHSSPPRTRSRGVAPTAASQHPGSRSRSADVDRQQGRRQHRVQRQPSGERADVAHRQPEGGNPRGLERRICPAVIGRVSEPEKTQDVAAGARGLDEGCLSGDPAEEHTCPRSRPRNRPIHATSPFDASEPCTQLDTVCILMS